MSPNIVFANGGDLRYYLHVLQMDFIIPSWPSLMSYLEVTHICNTFVKIASLFHCLFCLLYKQPVSTSIYVVPPGCDNPLALGAINRTPTPKSHRPSEDHSRSHSPVINPNKCPIPATNTGLQQVGGHRPHVIDFNFLEPYMLPFAGDQNLSDQAFKYVGHFDDVALLAFPQQHYIHANVPLEQLFRYIPVTSARKIAQTHGLKIGSHVSQGSLLSLLEGHSCLNCNLLVSVFSIEERKSAKQRLRDYRKNMSDEQKKSARDESKKCMAAHRLPFPPDPLDNNLSYEIISGSCNKMNKAAIEESGCAVCGEIVPKAKKCQKLFACLDCFRCHSY